MNVKRVSIFSKDYKKICELLCTSLPENEHLPLPIIYLLSLRKDIHYLSFYDEGQLIGLMYTIETKQLDYLLYLAVNPNIRSKGYGSKMMEWLSFRSGKKAVALDIERPNDKAPNFSQRLKRYKFYEKNGFKNTGYTLNYNGEDYIVLTNNNNFSSEAFSQLFKSFTYNLYKPKLKKLI